MSMSIIFLLVFFLRKMKSKCTKISQNFNKASIRLIVIRSDPKLLWRDSYKFVGCASTLPESLLHKIIIIIIITKITNFDKITNLVPDQNKTKIYLVIPFVVYYGI